MTKIEAEALGQFLSEFPESWSYDEVLTSIENVNVVVWEPFEDYDTDFIIQEIENLKMVMTDLVNNQLNFLDDFWGG